MFGRAHTVVMAQSLQTPTQRYLPAYDSHFPRVNQTFPIDVSVDRKQWVTLYPSNHDTTHLKDSFVEFVIDSEPACFIDFSSFNIEYNLQVTKASDGGAVGADQEVVFTNGLIHALTTSRKLFLNNELVEADYESNYTQYVNYLTTEDAHYTATEGTSMGYFIDSRPMASSVPKAEFPERDYKMKYRMKFAAQENIQLYGPLNLDIGKSKMLMVDRVAARLHLELADASQLIIKASDLAENYKIKIFSVKLHFKRITPAQNAYLELNKSLLSHNLEYNFERNLVYKTTVGANQRQAFLSQIFGSLIPNKLHIIMVSQQASIGNDKLNSHYLNHFNLDNIRVTTNGLSVLDSEISFLNKYASLFKRTIDAIQSKSHSINYDNFDNGYTLISVDCQNSDTNTVMQLERRGKLEIHMRFSRPLDEAINIIIIGSSNGTVEIDSERRVSTHYNY